ncbi:hypothetical protein [Paenibacillus sp. 1_12]|nr:hypothetical protein [Paenibacillus sp. 1_12]
MYWRPLARLIDAMVNFLGQKSAVPVYAGCMADGRGILLAEVADLQTYII